MSGGSSANNNWTILTPEETVAETLRPLAGVTEHHEETHSSAAGSGENNEPANGAESAEGLPADYPASEAKTTEVSGESSTDQHTSEPTAVTDTRIPSSLEVSPRLVYVTDEDSQAEGLPEGLSQFSPDLDSSSDSYTHIVPTPDEPPLSLLSTETLGGADFAQEEEKLTEEGTLHHLNGEELRQEGEESDQHPKTPDLGKQADSPVDSEVGEERTEKTGDEGEPEVRRRRSLLAALEKIGRREEEEEEEEDEFQLPQRDVDSGFSVNKCILGAIILLGLGTIFFSESDYGTRDLKDTELPGKQEWLNPEVPPPTLDADHSELLNKIADGSQQISVLKAQLQAQTEELKVAKGQAAEGAKERLRWEEVEKENSRLKTEMASLPVLQKENERMKKELESVPTLPSELKTLRSTVTELKLSSAQEPVKPTTSPPTGQLEDSRQGTAGSTERQAKRPLDDQKENKKDMKRDTYDMGEKKEWKGKEKSASKEGEKKESKEGGKEWKMNKHEQGTYQKEKDKEGKQKKHSDEKQQWKEKEWKKEKSSRGDEGKPWKDREGKKDGLEKSEKKEWKEEKDRRKGKHEKVNEGKQWKGKEEHKVWKRGKDHGEKHEGKEDWKREKDWKKMKYGLKESGKEKWEKKDWKEKGEKKEWKEKEKKEWKKDLEWRDKNGKQQGKEGKGTGERKLWEDGKNHGKERMGKDERKQWNDNEWKIKNGKHDKERKKKEEKREHWNKEEDEWKRAGQKEKKHNADGGKDKSNSQKSKDEYKFKGNHGHKEEHLYGDQTLPHTHNTPSLGEPEYWVQQRERLLHNPKPPQQCNSPETCAQAERLLPVPLSEFEAILQTYLAKAEEAGLDGLIMEKLKKLATEFFKDGVFVHDQMSFQEFVEDLGDILEDMVEGDETGDEGDSAIEDEMEGFEREVMEKFSMPGGGEKEERIKGDWRKGSREARG
ncbi:pre-B-cell leukemia homeobox interacting protein 1b isoform X2 [Brachyistius frenatus]|uniref:pre-B-cell leukemia homeobox interacting protein 1b isoform X2 n=1 Tax=Brachyistius frenatus TaxID=100188 RepID=UPI0037E71ABA